MFTIRSTNNHPLLTGKIVLAHLKETMLYYKLLDVVKIEGDLLKAATASKAAKLETLYKKLVYARLVLSRAEAEKMK